MSEINYPPSRTITFEDALSSAKTRVSEAENHHAALEDDDDATDEALQEARADMVDARKELDALQWAVDEFGGDAKITVEAHTTNRRSRVIDAANRYTMGDLGASTLNDWMIAAAVTDAPWLEGGEDLRERHEYLGALPPSLSDWIGREVQDLNQLGN